jgi:hypothetical protein
VSTTKISSFDPPRLTPRENRRRMRLPLKSRVVKSAATRCGRAGWRTVRRKPTGRRGPPIPMTVSARLSPWEGFWD